VLVYLLASGRSFQEPRPGTVPTIFQTTKATVDSLFPDTPVFQVKRRRLPKQRLRQCGRGCPPVVIMGDRMWHSTLLGRCLPLYSHYCSFLGIVVFLWTAKPYFHVLTFVPASGFASSVATIWLLAQPRPIPVSAVWYGPAIPAFFGVLLLFWRAFCIPVVKSVLFRNRLPAEAIVRVTGDQFRAKDHSIWMVVLRQEFPDGSVEMEFVNAGTWNYQHPFDRGYFGNLEHVLGPWYVAWLWFVPPPRVWRYGTYAQDGLTSDLPLNRSWIQHLRDTGTLPNPILDDPSDWEAHEMSTLSSTPSPQAA